MASELARSQKQNEWARIFDRRMHIVVCIKFHKLREKLHIYKICIFKLCCIEIKTPWASSSRDELREEGVHTTAALGASVCSQQVLALMPSVIEMRVAKCTPELAQRGAKLT